MSIVRLVGDIGGTNARFGILDADGRPGDIHKLRTDDFSRLAEAVRAYCQIVGVEHLDAAAVAVATEVTGDRIALTNNHWTFSRAELQAELGLGQLEVINDFTALALSLPFLPPEELVQIGGEAHRPSSGLPIAVVGPGTGLGVSGLFPDGFGGWVPVEGEGGHVSLGVRTAREYAVLEVLTGRFRHVSAERVLSGPGLQNIQSALRHIDGKSAEELTPAEITRRGVAGEDPVCVETLTLFCQLLGSVAGNLVLTLGARGGVYIGGGIVPQLGEFFVQSHFREHMAYKGRKSAYLEAVPAYVIMSDFPALTGVAQRLLPHA